MDTILLQPKHFPKLIANALNVSIVMGLLFSQHIFEGPPISAKELTLASSAIVSPILQSANLEKNIKEKISIEEQTQSFNEKIKQKYKQGVIIDVDRGVKQINLLKYYQGRPVKIKVIEANLNINPNLQLTPVLASDKLGKKSSIATIAKKNNSIVAINGTFRVAMGIFDNGYDMARIQLDASLKTFGKTLKVDNINQPRTLSTHVIVYTPEWGAAAPVSPQYGTQIVVADNKVINVSTSAQPIPENGFVVVGPAQKLNEFSKVKDVKFEVSTIPDWNNVNHIISGGPYLVKDAQVYVDVTEQKLGAIGGRNPRSAVGYTADGNLIIVAVDGREEASVGLTLTELANFMKSIGCVNAMNLDGGGSTVLYVNGKVVNNPKVQGGIALSNALTLNKID
jgi:exopolysaccharide biosynthesis protein